MAPTLPVNRHAGPLSGGHVSYRQACVATSVTGRRVCVAMVTETAEAEMAG